MKKQINNWLREAENDHFWLLATVAVVLAILL